MKIVVAMCSAVLWGSGQVLNKQKLKGIVFFILQGLLIFIELSTGTWNVLIGRADCTFRNCGFFIKGIWGLVTLGEIPRMDSSVLVYDHSIMLMVGGIIAVTVLLLFIFIWIWNIKDAYCTRVKMEKGEKVTSTTSG